MTDENADKLRQNVADQARFCLDHLRRVKWGAATVAYSVDDGDMRISVHIEIRSIGKTSERKTETDI